jgi:hypothetical protein
VRTQAPLFESNRPTKGAHAVMHKGEVDVSENAQGVHNLAEEKGQRQPQHPLCFTIMILPQVHLRKPCYDFYFL